MNTPAKRATLELIKRARGSLKRRPEVPSFSEAWAAHKKREKELEDRL